jgi:hypothetical protein
MNRVLWMTCVLCSVLGVMARADSPNLRTDPKPPWQRLLSGGGPVPGKHADSIGCVHLSSADPPPTHTAE